MSRARRTLGALGVLMVVATAGCGGSSETAPPPQRPPETADDPPRLPADWRPYVNQVGGFALGLPPGWKARGLGASTLIRSFDELVSMQVTPDRTDEALEFDPGEFAKRALAATAGYEETLEPGAPHPYPHRYEATAVEARGVSSDAGVEQRVQLIFLERPKLTTFTVLIAASATSQAAPARALSRGVLATLRGRPVGGAPSAG